MNLVGFLKRVVYTVQCYRGLLDIYFTVAFYGPTSKIYSRDLVPTYFNEIITFMGFQTSESLTNE